jgi:hypothetical protein
MPRHRRRGLAVRGASDGWRLRVDLREPGGSKASGVSRTRSCRSRRRSMEDGPARNSRARCGQVVAPGKRRPCRRAPCGPACPCRSRPLGRADRRDKVRLTELSAHANPDGCWRWKEWRLGSCRRRARTDAGPGLPTTTPSTASRSPRRERSSRLVERWLKRRDRTRAGARASSSCALRGKAMSPRWARISRREAARTAAGVDRDRAGLGLRWVLDFVAVAEEFVVFVVAALSGVAF